jgi:hypothetical protein
LACYLQLSDSLLVTFDDPSVRFEYDKDYANDCREMRAVACEHHSQQLTDIAIDPLTLVVIHVQ